MLSGSLYQGLTYSQHLHVTVKSQGTLPFSSAHHGSLLMALHEGSTLLNLLDPCKDNLHCFLQTILYRYISVEGHLQITFLIDLYFLK